MAFSLLKNIQKLGFIFLGVGTIYNTIIARWFLPSRAVVSSLTQKYHMGTYLTEFKVGPDSQLVDNTIRSLNIEEKYNLHQPVESAPITPARQPLITQDPDGM